jgi:hypothetical protein
VRDLRGRAVVERRRLAAAVIDTLAILACFAVSVACMFALLCQAVARNVTVGHHVRDAFSAAARGKSPPRAPWPPPRADHDVIRELEKGSAAVTTEPTYTLAEAKRELARRECVEHGHRWDVLEALGVGPTHIVCDRCGESRKVLSDDR